MGDGKWGMGNGGWEMGNGKWGTGNGLARVFDRTCVLGVLKATPAAAAGACSRALASSLDHACARTNHWFHLSEAAGIFLVCDAFPLNGSHRSKAVGSRRVWGGGDGRCPAECAASRNGDGRGSSALRSRISGVHGK